MLEDAVAGDVFMFETDRGVVPCCVLDVVGQVCGHIMMWVLFDDGSIVLATSKDEVDDP